MKRYTISFVLLCVLGLAMVRPALAQDANAAVVMDAFVHHAQEGVDAAGTMDGTVLQRESIELHATWAAIEDKVRDADPGIYTEIEGALDKMDDALKATPMQAGTVLEAFEHLATEARIAEEHLSTGVKSAAPAAAPATLADFQGSLTAALGAIEVRDEMKAEGAILGAIGMWPAVEGVVAAKSSDAYATIEGQLAKAGAALREEPVNWAAAQTAVAGMQAALGPLADQVTYTMFDSAAIILREGLEALLIVAALLAVLRRSNSQDKQIWVWGGAAVGVLLSIGAAFILQAIFNQVAAGQNREVIEGFTSLFAAGLLLYVSYWLHSKASLSGWQRYINTGTAQALARGNLIGLGLLALLAVFREGAETTVFYIGMAPAISAGDLLIGVGIGVALLAVAAWLMLVAGVRLPIRLFFRIAGVLVFYMGFKFVGTGIHSLQVAGVVSATPIPFLPAVPILGIYPTWETLIPQLLMLAFALAMTLHLQAQDRRVKVAATASA